MMSRKKIAWLVTVVWGCGFIPAKPDFTTEHGVRVFLGKCSYEKEKIELLLDVFAEQMPRLTSGITQEEIYNMYPWTTVLFKNHPLKFYDGEAYGTYGARTIYLWCNSQNLCETALLHEYTHMVQDIKNELSIVNKSAELHAQQEFTALNALLDMLRRSDYCR